MFTYYSSVKKHQFFVAEEQYELVMNKGIEENTMKSQLIQNIRSVRKTFSRTHVKVDIVIDMSNSLQIPTFDFTAEVLFINMKAQDECGVSHSD